VLQGQEGEGFLYIARTDEKVLDRRRVPAVDLPRFYQDGKRDPWFGGGAFIMGFR
jgi:hypothetical protein